VKELERRGWAGKRWQTRKGGDRGGEPFTRTSLYRLLTNVAYAGKVRYKQEVHDGEHAGIVDPHVFRQAQALLRRNGTTGGAALRNQFGAILKGLLRCGPCGCAMTPAHTTKRDRRYRYYVCVSAQKKGWDTCPSKSIPAQEVEAFVVEQIRCVGRDPALLREVLAQARTQHAARTAELETEERGLAKDLTTWQREVSRLSAQFKPGEDNGELVGRLADLHERIGLVEGRVRQVRDQIKSIAGELIPEEDAVRALSAFDPVWGTLTPLEQARVVSLLVERVVYDGAGQKVSVSFHPAGIKTLADELAECREERVA
jgi:site-specific DNA recombinase